MSKNIIDACVGKIWAGNNPNDKVATFGFINIPIATESKSIELIA